MGNTTIGSIILEGDGNSLIIENTARKEAFVSPTPFYTKDSDETDVYDFGGTIKTITLSGTYAGSTSAARTFIDSIEALIQGHQDVAAGYPLTFTDDLRAPNGMKVKIMDFESTKIEGQVTKVTWTLKLVESSSSA